MTKFKVGEKVCVYGNYRWRGDVMTYLYGQTCEVVSVNFEQEITVTHPEWGRAEVHPKQCRKLRAPLTFWINTYESYVSAYSSKSDADEGAASDRLACIEVMEVRKKKS